METPVVTPYWWEEQASYNSICDLEAEKLILNRQPDSGQQVPEWLTALLTSPIYHAQKKLAGRLAPADNVFTEVLVALDDQEGKMTSAMLARTVSCPSTKLHELLTVIQRVLNIEGYAVLTYNKAFDLVELNQDLLCQQFNLIRARIKDHRSHLTEWQKGFQEGE